MSYDIVAVKKDVAEYCQTNEINIAELLEKDSEKVTSFSEDEIKFFNKFLLTDGNYLGKFNLVSNNDMVSTFEYKDNVTVSLYTNYISFKALFNNSWDILMLTSDLMIQSNKNIIRFDFQDGLWE